MKNANHQNSTPKLLPGMSTALFWLVLAIAVAVPSSANAQEDVTDTWVVVHAGTLLAVPGQPPEREKTIVIRNDVIESVLDGYVPAADTGAADAQVVSLEDRFVLPGLMDLHVHLSNDRISRAARKHDNADRAVTAVITARIMLMSGFTTVRDTASLGTAVFSVRDAINQGRIPGPRVFASGQAISTTAGHGDRLLNNLTEQLFCDGPYDCRKIARQQIRIGADFVKISASGSGSDDNGGPDDPQEMLDDEIRAVVEAAHAMKRQVTAHSHGTAGINAALRNGVDSIEHGTFPDEESIRLYLENGAVMIPTLAFITGWDEEYLASLSPDQQIRKQQFLERQPKGVAMAHQAGVVIAAGSDFGGLIPHGESAREIIAYVELAGMTEMDAIVTATVNGAKLLRKENVLGTLEPGKYADLVATRTSPLDDIHVLADIPFVMKGGVVHKDEQ